MMFSPILVWIKCVVSTASGCAVKPPRQIAVSSVKQGNARAPRGDFFRVEADVDEEKIVLVGECARVKLVGIVFFFFFSSRRRHTRFDCDWSSDVCSSD